MRRSLGIVFLLFSASLAHADLQKAELQWEVCEDSAATFFQKMHLTPNEDPHEEYRMTYYDTADLSLLKNGIYARFEKKKKGDLLSAGKWKVKIEFNSADPIDFSWMDAHQAKCEVDVYTEFQKPRCALENKVRDDGDPWSDDQRALLQKYRPNFSIPAQLTAWGPYPGQNIAASFGDDTISMDATSVPRVDAPLLELSYRVDLTRLDSARAAMEQALRQAGVSLCPRQNGKFPRILELLGDGH